MAQYLRALVTLAEDSVPIPDIYLVGHNCPHLINPGEGWTNARLSPRTWCTEKEPGIYWAELVMAWGQSLKGVVASHPEKSVRPTMRAYNVPDILCSPLYNTVGLASRLLHPSVYGSF